MTFDPVLHGGLAVTLLINGLTVVLLDRAFFAPRYDANHFRAPAPLRATEPARWGLAVGNSTLSMVMLALFTVAGYHRFFSPSMSPTAGTVCLEVVRGLGALALYDFGYYWLHRGLHIKKLMRFIHRVHHLARTPSARDSLWVHPVEIAAGLGLFLACVAAVGPVSPVTFLVVNLIYSELNIVIHSGVEFPSGPMRLFNPWARAHHGHHGVDINRNFASVTSLWDLLLGTYVSGARAEARPAGERAGQ
jgi:sterol desaturase/sphingolipid hydroxylase (fatty acid hydroxylase superfamily)